MVQLEIINAICRKTRNQVAFSGLTVENAVETLLNLDKYAPDDGVVKEEVISFIKMNTRKVVEGEDWKVFVKNYEGLANKIVKPMVN